MSFFFHSGTAGTEGLETRPHLELVVGETRKSHGDLGERDQTTPLGIGQIRETILNRV